MESKTYAVALLVLVVTGFGNGTAVNRELRKINNRIRNNRQNIYNMQQNIVHLGYENRELMKELDKANNRTSELEIKLESALSTSLAVPDNELIVQLEYENRKLRKELDKANNRTSELEIKLESALSYSLAITDNGSKARDELEKIKDVINILAKDIEHLKRKPFKSTSHSTITKAFVNETSLGRHIEDIGNLHNTTSEHEEAILEITTRLDKINTALANTDIRINRHERLLTAVSDCGSHAEIPNGSVSGDSFVGSTPLISCNSGYSQTGSAQCKIPVTWETDVKCQKDCTILHVAHGMVTPATSVPHGTTVTVTCDSGYAVVGNSTAFCDNGDFTDVPSCRRPRPLTAPDASPRDLTTVAVEGDDLSVTLNWLPPQNPNGQITVTGYLVFYTTDLSQDDLKWVEEGVKGENLSLTITDLTEDTIYYFKVQARNSEGYGPMSPTIIYKTPKAPDPAPRNVRARLQDPQTILIEWDKPAIRNGAIQGYQVFYTTEIRLPVVLWDTQKVNTDTRMAAITGLVPNSTYTICLLAYTTTGQGPLSEPIQVMTRAEAPLQPINLLARTLSPNELEITWTPPEDVDKITQYTLYYNDSWLHQNIQITVYPPTTEYKLTDLIPDTLYHIQLSARSALGEGAKSVIVQARTPEFMPGKPRRVQVVAVNSTTIYVEWRPPKSRERNGIIRGYYVYCVEVGENDDPVVLTQRIEDTGDGNRNELVIVGLKPGTRYHIQVAGYTRKGDGMRSNPITVTTNGAVPTAPRHLTAQLMQHDRPQVHVSWQRPEQVNGRLMGYRASWGRMGHTGGGYMKVTVIYTKQQSLVTKDLDKGARYEFGVLAKNEIDYGERAVIMIDTPEGVPEGAPEHFLGSGSK